MRKRGPYFLWREKTPSPLSSWTWVGFKIFDIIWRADIWWHFWSQARGKWDLEVECVGLGSCRAQSSKRFGKYWKPLVSMFIRPWHLACGPAFYMIVLNWPFPLRIRRQNAINIYLRASSPFSNILHLAYLTCFLWDYCPRDLRHFTRGGGIRK